MTNPVRVSPPGDIVRSKDCGGTLLLGDTVVGINWIEASDDDLARLLLALIGETTLAEVLDKDARDEDV